MFCTDIMLNFVQYPDFIEYGVSTIDRMEKFGYYYANDSSYVIRMMQRRRTMTANAIRIRWFNDACYEIHLSNGKGILVDPYIDESKFRTLSYDDVEKADYILVSHTHFDHVMGLARVSQRFDSAIFAGSGAGMELAECYDVPGYRMHLCSPGDVIENDDFTLRCFRGRHTKLGDFDRPSRWPENIRRDGLDPKTERLNMLGSYEYMIYLLELPDHTRLLVWGGGATEEAIRQARDFHPTVTIAQLPRETTDQIARLYAAIGGQLIFPHHHDFFIEQGADGMKVIRETVDKTRAMAPQTRVICPEKGRWYTIQTSVTLEE